MRKPDRTIELNPAFIDRVPKELLDLRWMIGEEQFVRVEIDERFNGDIRIQVWDKRLEEDEE